MNNVSNQLSQLLQLPLHRSQPLIDEMSGFSVSHPRSQALPGIAQGRLCLRKIAAATKEAKPPSGFHRQSLGTREQPKVETPKQSHCLDTTGENRDVSTPLRSVAPSGSNGANDMTQCEFLSIENQPYPELGVGRPQKSFRITEYVQMLNWPAVSTLGDFEFMLPKSWGLGGLESLSE